MQDRSFFSRNSGPPAPPKAVPPTFGGAPASPPPPANPGLARGSNPYGAGYGSNPHAPSAPTSAPAPSSNVGAPGSSGQQNTAGSPGSIDELTRIFNSSLVATRGKSARDFSSEILDVAQSPAFRTILFAVRQQARSQGITDRQAAEQVIQAFRRMDQAWADYVFQEGVDRLKGRS